MKIYLVGGAIRDQLLGYPVKERDWVVVGATPQEMLDQGYRSVGKDFPVFLHPTTHEEYALARTERKTGPGYKGFAFYAAPDVTLAEDLQRRDLTINAIAQDSDGVLIDPYGGKADLEARILRHVSPAFAEDPVRILRVARFAARFLDFQIDLNTLKLMQEMVRRQEVNALVAERVWQEWEKALQENSPVRFFEILSDCQALPILFPELVENPLGFKALQRAAEQQLSAAIRFAVLFYAIDKPSIQAVCQRYRVPKEYSELALLIWGNYADYARVPTFDAAAFLSLLERLDVFRRPTRLDLFLSGCKLIFHDETGDLNEQRMQLLRATSLAAKSVSVSDLAAQRLSGEEIRKILRERQLTAINQLLRCI